MKLVELIAELNAVRVRFGDLEVRAGGAPITQLAVLPYAAVEHTDNGQQPNMDQFVALLSRQEDKEAFFRPTWP